MPVQGSKNSNMIVKWTLLLCINLSICCINHWISTTQSFNVNVKSLVAAGGGAAVVEDWMNLLVRQTCFESGSIVAKAANTVGDVDQGKHGIEIIDIQIQCSHDLHYRILTVVKKKFIPSTTAAAEFVRETRTLTKLNKQHPSSWPCLLYAHYGEGVEDDYFITSFVRGRTWLSMLRSGQTMSADQAVALGRVVTKLHSVSAEDGNAGGNDGDIFHRLAPYVERFCKANGIALPDMFQSDVDDVANRLNNRDLQRLVHSDLCPDNIVFSGNNKVFLIDFSMTRLRLPEFDTLVLELALPSCWYSFLVAGTTKTSFNSAQTRDAENERAVCLFWFFYFIQNVHAKPPHKQCGRRTPLTCAQQIAGHLQILTDFLNRKWGSHDLSILCTEIYNFLLRHWLKQNKQQLPTEG